MKHDIMQLRAVTDVNSRQVNTVTSHDFLGITCDLLGINRQLILVVVE